jgi:hypothetical protein
LTNRLSSWESPTWRDRIAWLVGDTVGALGASNQTQRRFSNSARSWIDMVPVLNDAVGIDETGRALAEGNYREAAMKGIPTAFGLIPGGGDFAAPIAKAIFAGIGAKTANRELMKTAEKMAGEGASRESIWDATGWFKGPDDKWRFEIDDSTSKLTPKAADELMSGDGGAYGATQRTAPGVLQHPGGLYEAYPGLRLIDVDARHNVKLSQGKVKGSYQAGRDSGGRPSISIQSNSLEGGPRSVRGLSLHELQHGVEDLEGFSPGGNNFSVFGHSDPNVRAAVQQEMDQLLRTLTPEEYNAQIKPSWPDATEAQLADSYKDYLKSNKEARANIYHPANKAAQETAAMNVYRRMAGEVEARNVQTRMNMTPEQRRATYPWATQDIPDGLQIVGRR